MRKLVNLIADYSYDPKTKRLVIYEFQQLAKSSFTETSELSPRKLEKAFQEVLNKLEVDFDHEEYILTSKKFNKKRQRELMQEHEFGRYQVRFTSINSKELHPISTTKAHNYQKINDFLTENPDIKRLYIKKSVASRGKGNFLMTREELETAIKDESLHIATLEKCTKEDIEHSDSIQTDFVLEEFENPLLTASNGQTSRAFMSFNPETKEFHYKTLVTCHHQVGNVDSHSLYLGGFEDDYIKGRRYYFGDRVIDKVEDFADEPINPELEVPFSQIVNAIFDPEKHPELFTIRQNYRDYFSQKKHSYKTGNKYATAMFEFVNLLKRVDEDHEDNIEKFLHILNENDKEFSAETLRTSLTKDLELLSKLMEEENKSVAKNLSLEILDKYLPIFLLAPIRETLNSINHTSEPNDYHLKKLLGLKIIGDLDKETTDHETYKKYKDTLDRFLLMPIKEDDIKMMIPPLPSTSTPEAISVETPTRTGITIGE